MDKSSAIVRGTVVLGCLFFLSFSAPAPAFAGGVYFVKAGDTLTGISRIFGVDLDRIRELNRLAFGQDQEGNIVDARFGFKPAGTYGITCEWELPADVFMVLILDPTVMTGVSGAAKYRPEFSSAS